MDLKVEKLMENKKFNICVQHEIEGYVIFTFKLTKIRI